MDFGFGVKNGKKSIRSPDVGLDWYCFSSSRK